MATGFGGVEALSSLNRYFLKLSNLTNQLRPFGLLVSKLFGSSFGGFLKLFVDFISDSFVFSMFGGHHLTRFVLATVDFFDQSFSLLVVFLHVFLSFFLSLLRLDFHLKHKRMVFPLLTFLCKNSLLTGELHFNLFLLDVLQALDVVALVHLAPPPVEVTGILETHGHLFQLFMLLDLFTVD